MKQVVLSVIVLIIHFVAQAQNVKTSTSISSNTIYVGDTIVLTLTATYNKDVVQVIQPIIQASTIAPLEILNTTKQENNNGNSLQVKYTISCYDSGYYNLSNIAFGVTNIATGEQIFAPCDSTFVLVKNVLVSNGAGIKDIMELTEKPKPLLQKYFWFIVFAIGLLFVGLLVYFLIYSTKLKNAFTIFNTQIKHAKQIPYTAVNAKEYYSTVTYALKQFIQQRYFIPMLANTTSNCAALLNNSVLQHNAPTIIQLLQTADAVKFANSIPTIEQAKQDGLLVEQIGATIEKQYQIELKAKQKRK